MSETKRKFRDKITIGVLEDMDMTIDEMSDIANLRKMKLPMLRLFINAMILEGEPITRESDPRELESIIPELSSFLGLSQRKELAKERLKQNRMPKP
jgi:hypothetical protein